MEFNNLPGTCPHTLATIGASLVNNGDFGFEKLDGIFRADSYAASAEIAFAGYDVNHQWSGTRHSCS